MVSNAIIPGSLSAISQQNKQSLAISFLDCEALLLLDLSGSMEATDTPSGESRRKVATDHLIRLQKNHSGKIALFCFADYVVPCPAGLPQDCGGDTNLYSALEHVQKYDDLGMKIIIVSDGVPSRKEDCLSLAKQFKNKLDTIFVGPEDDWEGGRAFLKKLSKMTGGESLKSDAPGLLAQPVETLLLRG